MIHADMLCRARLAHPGASLRANLGLVFRPRARHVHQLQSLANNATKFAAASPAIPTLAPAQAEVGDLVEFCNGNQRELGIVTFSPAGDSFDCALKDGTTKTIYLNSVTLSLRPTNQQERGMMSLQVLEREALANAAKLGPFLDAAHAYLCLPLKLNAVDLCELTKLVYAAKHSSGRFYNSNFKSNSVNAQQILATYFAASKSEKFTRIGRAPFMAVSEHQLEQINRVMFGLAHDDLHRAGTEIALYKPDTKLGLLASTVANMLRFFSVTNIEMLRPLVTTIERVLNERKLRQAQATENERDQAKQRLEAFNIAQSVLPVENPFLTRGLLAWPLEDNILDDSLDLRSTDFVTPNLDVDLPIEERPVVAVNDDFALGLDPDLVPERWVVSIYIPLVPALSHRSRAAWRAKSMVVDNKRLHFTPLALRSQHCLRPDVARPCLRISSTVRPWDAKFDLSQIQLSIVKARATNEGHSGSVGSGASWRFAKLERCLNIWAEQRQGSWSCDFDEAYMGGRSVSVDRTLAMEARLLAGEWLGAWAAASNEVRVPYLCKTSATSKEFLSTEPEKHVGIGASIYTPIAYPFESAIASHALRNIVRALPNGQQIFPGLLDHNHLPAPNVVAASEAVDAVSSAAKRFAELMTVKAANRMVFPCELVEAAWPGERANAWCPTLGLEVQVMASSTQLHAGDRVLCTDIIELDPIEGSLVFAA